MEYFANSEKYSDPNKEESLDDLIRDRERPIYRSWQIGYAPFYRKLVRAVTRRVFRVSICDDEILRSVFRICRFASFQPHYSPRNGMQFPREYEIRFVATRK